jgi:hypothetical protein
MTHRTISLVASALLAACAGDSANPSTSAAADSAPATQAVAQPQLGDTAYSRQGGTNAAPTGQGTGVAAGAIVPQSPTSVTSTATNPATGLPTASTTPNDGFSPTTPAPTTPSLTTPAQTAVVEPAPSGTTKPRRSSVFAQPVPFAPGERLVYDVKFGALDVGDAVMEVTGVEQVRGRDTYHVNYSVKGGTFFYKVNDRYESWIDTLNLISLRHGQQSDEGSYERERKYEIMPEIGVYKENEKPSQPTVAEPLDDGSFFFFLRSIPLEVGQTYTFDRYFKPDRNPVTVTVVRREKLKVPAGTFEAIVLHPSIKAKGVFGEGGQAEIWLADDSSRVMLQMKSKLKFGSLNLYLKKLTKGVQPVLTSGTP